MHRTCTRARISTVILPIRSKEHCLNRKIRNRKLDLVSIPIDPTVLGITPVKLDWISRVHLQRYIEKGDDLLVISLDLHLEENV